MGFGGAVVAAVLLGLLAFLSPLARGVVADGLAVLNSTSVFVWIVISIIWFGLSNWAPIFTTLMITLPVVASNIVEGVASVDRRLLEMGDVYRLSGGRKFRAIVVPSTLPYLIAGMKVGFGLALKVSVVAEIFGVTSGIGYIMNYSREILATQMVFVWAIVMILVMTATDKLLFDPLSPTSDPLAMTLSTADGSLCSVVVRRARAEASVGSGSDPFRHPLPCVPHEVEPSRHGFEAACRLVVPSHPTVPLPAPAARRRAPVRQQR